MSRPKKKPAAKKRAPKSRSGATISHEERKARGYVAVQFSLAKPISLLIGVLAAKLGVSRSDVVARAVNGLFGELAGTLPAPISADQIRSIAAEAKR
jgi:hypothetical protein